MKATTGYICKTCGEPSPVGVGYKADTPQQTDVEACPCGASRKPVEDPVIQTFDIRLEHPNLDGPLELEVNASSERAAILRCRHGAMHMYQEAEFLDEEIVTATVLNVREFVPGERG